MTIWHWIVLALFIAFIAWCVVRERRLRNQPDDLVQVRGWLAVLVAGLMFLGPLVGASRINSDLLTVEREYPQLVQVAQWASYKQWAWITFGAAALVSIFAGWRLAFTRRRGAVRLAIVALWVSGPLTAVALITALPAAVFGSFELTPDAAGGLTGSFVGAVVWTAYLWKSKRVRARYVEGGGQGVAGSVALD